MLIKILICFFIFFNFSNLLFAKDLGVRGPVYEIAEENLLLVIQRKFQEMQQNDQWAKIQQSIQDKAAEQIKAPEAVKGLTSAKQSRRWSYDPTWTLSQPIYDLKGRLIAKEGQKINPLDFIPLTEILVFIDATIEKEIQYLERMLFSEEKEVKVIFVNGSVADCVKRLNSPIYFDQKGQITTRWGIKHTPAIVRQQGKVLALEEIAL